MANAKMVPVQALLEGEYLRVYKLHKDLNKLSVIPHRHDHYELMLVTQGQGTHSIDFKPYALKPGRVFFLHPGQVHLIEEFDRDGWLILFGEELYKRFLTLHPNEDHYGVLDFYSQSPFIDLSDDIHQVFEYLIRQLKQELDLSKQDISIQLHYVSLILMYAQRAHVNQHPSQAISPRQKQLLHQLKKLVEKNFRQQHLASFYSNNLSTDIKLLNKICRQATGLSVYQLLQERLLTESKILLQTSPQSVKEISYQLGFKDPAFFGRFFKRYTQLTPLAFRQSRTL